MRSWRGFLFAFFCVELVTLAKANVLGERVPNDTLQMPLTPHVVGFATTNALGGMVLDRPFAVVSPPGETNRLFILEKVGRIVVVTNLANPTRTLFMDISSRVFSAANEEGLLGMAFHPGYKTNRNFYLFYTGPYTTTNANGSLNIGRHDRLSRFTTSAGNPNQAPANSEVPLIAQYDRDSPHNAGDLHFGPDGYLYVSLGDEGAGFDSYQNSQRIDKNYFSAILRIDVDKRPTNLVATSHPSRTTNYFVPSDNPFVRATNFNGLNVDPKKVRTEFWAVGLRNPWRFTFNPGNGNLLCADVGQEGWEEINMIAKGGNYGWAFREDSHPGPKSELQPPGFSGINPLLEYSHGSAAYLGNAVIGGVFYTGDRIPQLTGAYVFGDHISGNIWSLRYSGTNVTEWNRLMHENFPTSFGIDPSNGDVLIVKHTENQIKRLICQTNSIDVSVPPTLADTGAFSDLYTLTPHPGIIPYDVNVPFWSDNADKSRWFSVPDTNLTIGFSAENNWSFPTGTVWIKHFDLEMTNGMADSARRIETRFLVRNLDGVYGVTYRWGDSLTNALLVPDEGLDETFIIHETNGTTRNQTWHYPSRQECLICHTTVGGHALGFNTPQLNRDFDYGGAVENQIRALSLTEYLSSPVTNVHNLRAFAHATNNAVSLDYRIHSYLAVNCVQCHQPGGAGLGQWDARITTRFSSSGIINGRLQNGFGIDKYRVIAPGSIGNSILLSRINTLGNIRMPPLSSHLINTQAVQMISEWITNGLNSYQSFTNWQLSYFGATNSPNSLSSADPDSDGANNYLEYLTATHPLQSTSVWSISINHTPTAAQIHFPQIANRGFEVQYTTNLFAPINWQPLDIPANRQFFSATNFQATIEDYLNGAQKFYRVRPIEH